MKLPRPHPATAAAFALLVLQTNAFAQPVGAPGATITYAPFVPSPTAVPTLSEWGLGALLLLMAVIGYRRLRTSPGSKPLASLVIAGALGLCGLVGNKVLAIPLLGGLDNPAGAASHVCSAFAAGTVILGNSTSVPLQIVSVVPDVGSAIGPGTTCTPGHVVPPGNTCGVDLTGTSSACPAPFA